MKNLLFIPILLISISNILAQNTIDLKVREINYGESNAEILYETKMKNSPSGDHNTTESNLQITKRTDSIFAKVGSQFGVEYELKSKKNELTDIIITWIFPEGMKDISGKPVKEISYKTTKMTNSYTYSNYTLEGPNEVVFGKWTFILSKDGIDLYRKNFYLLSKK